MPLADLRIHRDDEGVLEQQPLGHRTRSPEGTRRSNSKPISRASSCRREKFVRVLGLAWEVLAEADDIALELEEPAEVRVVVEHAVADQDLVELEEHVRPVPQHVLEVHAADVPGEQVEGRVDERGRLEVRVLADHVHLVEVERDLRMVDALEELEDRLGPVEERVRPRLDQHLRAPKVETVEHAQHDLPELAAALVGEHVRVDRGDAVGGGDAADEDHRAVAVHEVRRAQDRAERVDPLRPCVPVPRHEVEVRDRLAHDDAERPRELAELDCLVVAHLGDPPRRDDGREPVAVEIVPDHRELGDRLGTEEAAEPHAGAEATSASVTRAPTGVKTQTPKVESNAPWAGVSTPDERTSASPRWISARSPSRS